MSLSDRDILLRVRRGQTELFGELHVRHYPRILRYVRQFVFDPDIAEGVALEAFVKTYRRAHLIELAQTESLLPYLYAAASSCISDHRRQQQAQNWARSMDEGAPPAAGWVGRPDTQVIEGLARQERAQRVRQALAGLCEDDRQVILLAYDRGLTRAEIAQITGKPSVSAVTTHLYRALKKLRAALESDELFQGLFQDRNSG